MKTALGAAAAACLIVAALRKRRRTRAGAGTAGSSSGGAASGTSAAPTRTVRLRILTDVYASTPHPRSGLGGLAELSTMVKAARSAAPEGATTLFVACGDLLGGSALAETFQGKHMVEVFTAIGTDMAVIGNHEFDYGDKVLQDHIAGTPFPWLGANVRHTDTGELFKGAIATTTVSLPTVEDRRVAVDVGVFGVCTQSTPTQSYPDKTTKFLPVTPVSLDCVDELERRGCAVVVGLTHVSLAHDLEIAAAADDRILALLGGHDHTPYAQLEGHTLVMKCGQNAYWLGVVDIEMSVTGSGAGATVTRKTVGWSMLPNVGYAPDPAVARIIHHYEELYEAQAGLGDIGPEVPLVTFESGLDTRTDVVRREEAAVGNMIADAMAAHFGAVMGIINGGFIRGDRQYDPGFQWTVGDMMKELPFPKLAQVVRIKGVHLRTALTQMLRLCPAPTGSYPHLSSSGRMQYNSRNEIVSLTIGGEEVKDGQSYKIAITGFMFGGGDGATAWTKSMDITSPNQRLRVARIVYQQLSAGPSTINPTVEGRVTLVET